MIGCAVFSLARRSVAGVLAQARERLLRVPALARKWLWALAAGLALSWMFQRSLAGVAPQLWLHRDDGVITMSHARNLVDYGFVGVNPSGERVEGFSAPLQFALFALAYAATHVGYARFADAQTWLGSLGLGVALFWILAPLAGRAWLALLSTLLAGFLLQRSATFLLWHGSGMENALTHVTYAATWAVLIQQLERPRIALGWAIVPLLAACSRFESILHIAPLLAWFAVFHYRTQHTRSALRFAGACLAGWSLWFLGRAAYFGHWLPNTAAAQDIPARVRLEWLVLGRLPRSALDLAWSVFQSNLGIAVVLGLSLLVVMPARPRTRFVAGLAALSALSALLNVLVFDGARLDPPRTTTFLAPLAVAALVGIAASHEALPVTLALFGLCVSAPLEPFLRVAPYELCCAASDVEETRVEFQQFREQQRLPRPLVANPDLGALSFAKEFNVLDLGYLGSSVLPRLFDTASTNDYVYRIAAPDMIELHATWLQDHANLLADPRLAALYLPWEPPRADAEKRFWIRKAIRLGARSNERTLIDALAVRHEPSLVTQAVQECNAALERDGCLYVMRTVYRLLPDLSAAQADQVRAALHGIADPKQRDLALAVLSDGTRDLAGAVRRYLEGSR